MYSIKHKKLTVLSIVFYSCMLLSATTAAPPNRIVPQPDTASTKKAVQVMILDGKIVPSNSIDPKTIKSMRVEAPKGENSDSVFIYITTK
jgi:hypothetical protein